MIRNVISINRSLTGTNAALRCARRELPELCRSGSFHPLLTDDVSLGIFAFARDLGGQSVYVVLNRKLRISR